jgi:catechol 2,3-dioxygenase-like lactoylglutathione lyase family enzyme
MEDLQLARIKGVQLRLRPSTERLYLLALGIRPQEGSKESRFIFPLQPDQFIEIHTTASSFAPASAFPAAYWKFGLLVTDVCAATAHLVQAGFDLVDEPAQFEDVGYLSCLRDDSNMTIEVLQRGDGLVPEAVLSGPISGPILGQITVRTSDIQRSLDFWCHTMGLKLCCRHEVPKYQFSLYFLASADAPLQEGCDIASLKQAPFAMLEIQHYHEHHKARETERHVESPDESQAGFVGIVLEISSLLFLDRLYRAGVHVTVVEDEGGEGKGGGEGGSSKQFRLQDPDGLPMVLELRSDALNGHTINAGAPLHLPSPDAGCSGGQQHHRRNHRLHSVL